MRFSLVSIFSLLGLSLASPIPVERKELEARETSFNAFLTILLANLPALDGTISSVVGALTTVEALLASLTGDTTTYNDLTGACKEYTIIFARGTTEPGNVGILVGPPLFDALKAVVGSGNVAVQGVNDYAASIDGYLAGGDATGSAEMATQIKQAHSQCPSTKLVVSGYSQGGQLVHNAIALLPAATAAAISSVVIFGDPDDGKALPNVAASKVDTFCHLGDDICIDGDLILLPHLTYADDALAAVAFIVSH